MIIPSSSWASSMTRIGLTAITAAIAVILLTANITIINAQQQEQATSPPSAIEDGAAAGATTFQSTTDSFGVQVPEGWVIQDLNNTDSALLEETRQGYGILAQLCPEDQQQQQGAASSAARSNTSSICDPSENDVIHIVRYPDLDTRLLANNVTFDDNMTIDNILSYHLQKLQEVGYRSIQIVNGTDMTLNLTNPQTNETIATVPAKLVEMTYSTNFAPNETRAGYFISTATNATTPNPGTTKGYSVFYEGSNSTNTNTTATTAAEITTATAAASGSLLPPLLLPPAVGQVFDSFELLAAPEVVAQEEAQTAETTQGGDFNDANATAVVEEDDNGADEDDDDGGDGDEDTSCHSSYPDTCIPPPPPNLNCDDVEETNFEVVGSDPHGFDGDNDGVGCEDGDEGEGGGEGNNPDEFEGCIVPPGRDPGDVGC
jgi:hypothetical protein